MNPQRQREWTETLAYCATPTRAAILLALLNRGAAPSVRKLAKSAGYETSNCGEAIRRLESMGIVRCQTSRGPRGLSLSCELTLYGQAVATIIAEPPTAFLSLGGG